MNMLIKKIGIILGLFFIPVLSYANQISSWELNNQIKEWNILSDSYITLSVCSTTKDGYNKEFSNYKRSECFLHEWKYYYFICELGSSCRVNITSNTPTSEPTTNTQLQDIPNKARLDAFLSKVKSM